jgi:hypothetical protein
MVRAHPSQKTRRMGHPQAHCWATLTGEADGKAAARSLRYAVRRAKLRRGRKDRATSVEMTKQDKANPRVKSRSCEALDRKNPPFAKNAKDGAPSSTSLGGVDRECREKSRRAWGLALRLQRRRGAQARRFTRPEWATREVRTHSWATSLLRMACWALRFS